MTHCSIQPALPPRPASSSAPLRPRAAPLVGRIGWAPARRAPRAALAPRAQAAPHEAPLFQSLGERLQRTAKGVGTRPAEDWAGRMRSAVARYLHAEKALAHSRTRQLPDELGRRRALLETLRVMENMCDAAEGRVPADLVEALQRDGHWDALLQALRLRHTEVLRPARFNAPELQPPRTHSVLVDSLRAYAEALKDKSESPVVRQWCATMCNRIVHYIEREAAYAKDPANAGNLPTLRAAAAELAFMMVKPDNRVAQKLLGWEELVKDDAFVELIGLTRWAIDVRRLELRPEWAEV